MTTQRLHKMAIPIQFRCDYSGRQAQIDLSDYDMDSVIKVTLLARPWIPVIVGHFPEFDMITLEWHETGDFMLIPGPIINEMVELQYTSKVLDREQKLNDLGVI